MKKLLALLCVTCLLCGCAETTVQNDIEAAGEVTTTSSLANETAANTTATTSASTEETTSEISETSETSVLMPPEIRPGMAMGGPGAADASNEDSAENSGYLDRLLTLSEDEVTYLKTSYYAADGTYEAELDITDKAVASEIFAELKSLEFLPRDEEQSVYFDAMRDEALYFGFENGDELTVMYMISEDETKHIGINIHGEDERGKKSYLLDYDKYMCDYTALVNKCDELLAPIAKEQYTEKYNVDLDSEESETGEALVVGENYDGSSGLKSYPANVPSVIESVFYPNTDKTCYTTFEYGLETNKNGKWVTVEPIGELEQSNGSRFSDFDKKHCFVDLACYPLLPAGKYRITKPYKVEGDETVYTAYYRFDIKDMPEEEANITGTITCEKSVYPVDCGYIKALYDYNYGDSFFSTSEVYDIERNENGKWVSVRRGKVKTNSIGSGRVLSFLDGIEVDSSLFDLSREGEYRIRVSVGEMDGLDFVDRHSTLYAYFSLEILKLEGISAECTDNELNDMDETLSFKVTNKALADVTVVNAVVKDKNGDVILEDKLSTRVYSGDDREINIPLKKPLSVGDYTVQFSVEAQGYADTSVTVSIKVEKASEEEKNSGVFITFDKDSYPLKSEKIEITVENKLYSKNDIMVFVAGCYKDDAPACLGMPLDHDEEKLILKYGEKKTFTLVNYGSSYEALKKYYSIIFSDSEDEELKEYLDGYLKEMWAEIENIPESALGVPGEYTVMLMYSEYENGNMNPAQSDIIEAKFKVE